jgi:DNA polymerase-3 subunit epsilon
MTDGILVFDVESTSVDVFGARIVQAFLGLLGRDGHWRQNVEWIIDPGVDMPAEAAAIHGFTTERLRAEGRKDVAEALTEIAWIIRHETGRGTPLVIFNAPYDTTVLNTELKRHGLEPIDYASINVVDPLVLDRAFVKFRKGKGARKLTALVGHYGVPLEENAHDAGADCLMTGRLALRMMPRLGDLAAAQSKQATWAKEQAADLQKWFRTKGGKPDEVVNGQWPVRTR